MSHVFDGGGADDTAALNSFMAASGPGIVELPLPSYNIAGTLVMPNSVYLAGQGKDATVLRAIGPDGQVVIAAGMNGGNPHGGVRGLSVQHAARQTQGSSIVVQNAHGYMLDDISTYGSLNAVDWRGGADQYIGWLRDFELHASGSAILVGASGGVVENLNIRDGGCYANDGADFQGIGLNLINVSGMSIDDVEAMGMQRGMLIAPPPSCAVKYLLASKLWLDTNELEGLLIKPQGGQVCALDFTQIWSASSVTGCGAVLDGTTGPVNSVAFNAAKIFNNHAHGAYINRTVNTSFANPSIGGNGQGGRDAYACALFVEGGASHLTMTGGKLGSCGDIVNIPEQQKFGVVIAPGADFLCFDGVDMTGNLTQGACNMNGPGPNRRFNNCLGV